MSADASTKDFPRVYQRELDYVWKVLVRLGVQTVDREDVAHDVFVAAFRHWPSFDASRPIRPWLFGIAFRVVLDRKRKHQHRFEELVEFVDREDDRDNVENLFAQKQRLELAQRALQAVEFERRAVFILHEIDGVAMPEIAETLRIPLNTAYSRLRLARRDFNRAADALLGGGE